MSSLPSDGAPLAHEATAPVIDAVELTVPSLGPSVESATIVTWAKQVGERVAADEPICRLAVNELQFEVCSTADGELTHLFAMTGDSVRGGDSLAEVTPTVSSAPPDRFYETDPPGAILEPQPEPLAEPAPQPEPVIELAPEPEALAQFAPEPEAVVETPAPVEEVAPEPAAEPAIRPEPEPERAPEPIVELAPEPELDEPIVELAPEPEPELEPQAAPEPERDGNWPPADGDVDWSRWHSPVVRKLTEEHGIDLSEVEGTGIGGRVRKRDVLAHV